MVKKNLQSYIHNGGKQEDTLNKKAGPWEGSLIPAQVFAPFVELFFIFT